MVDTLAAGGLVKGLFNQLICALHRQQQLFLYIHLDTFHHDRVHCEGGMDGCAIFVENHDKLPLNPHRLWSTM